MKRTLALLTLISFANASHALDVVWDCPSVADPDRTDVKIYKEGRKYYAEINQYYGDGDGFDEDLIEVTPLNSGSADADTYAQVPASQPTNASLVRNPTRKTQGALIRVSHVKDVPSLIAGFSAPNGDDLVDDFLDCGRN